MLDYKNLKTSQGLLGWSISNLKESVKFYTNPQLKSSFVSDNSSKELTLWNKHLGFSSHNRRTKITNLERNMLQLTPRVRSIIVGLIISGGWMNKNGHWNPRIGLKQSVKNFLYLWVVYNELAYLCSGPLQSSKSVMRGKTFYSLAFQTRQLICLIEIFNLFYIKVNNKIKKTIKPELFFYLDYIALAHFVQWDGSKKGKGINLNTQNFTLEEVVLLINILIIKFDIKPTLQKHKPDVSIYTKSNKDKEKMGYRIYINKKDLNKMKPHLLPHFSDQFLYKIS